MTCWSSASRCVRRSRPWTGSRLRELSAQRRQLVTALTQEVQRLAEHAGQAVSAQVEREVRDTLEAALADPGVAGCGPFRLS